jgi:hypothetical protein
LEVGLSQNSGGATLSELSQPANSYFVCVKADALAAIRVAHQTLVSEMAMRGSWRRLSLWELVEGGNDDLTTRFAQFVGHVLVQARSSTGAVAMYVSHQSIMTNSIQARVALRKLTAVAVSHASMTPLPKYKVDVVDGELRSNISQARDEAMNAASRAGNHVAVALDGYGGLR